MTLFTLLTIYAVGALVMLLYAGWANRAEDLRSPLFVAFMSALFWPVITPLVAGEWLRNLVRSRTGVADV